MKTCIRCLLVLFPFLFTAQSATFTFNINGSVPAGFTQALIIAGQRWSEVLQISVPVKVNVFTVNSSFLPFSGITLTNGRQNFANAPVQNVLYMSALANQLAGTETNPGEYDMDIYFNLATPFYFGTGKPSSSSIDFISTALHEIGHGLGFYSAGFVDGSGIGSFGNIPATAIFPLTTSFPWRGQEGVPTIYDKFIVRASNNSLVGCAANNSMALGDSIENGAHYFNGLFFANSSHSNTAIRLAGGSGAFALGEDLLHIHDSYANTIMSYYWGLGDTVRTPAPWEIGILKEIGWNRESTTGWLEAVNNTDNTFSYPNPANSKLYVRGNEIQQLELFTVLGERRLGMFNKTGTEQLELELEDLHEGVYFLRISFNYGQKTSLSKIVVKH